MSKEAYYFIGGLMKHIKAMTFITNPIRRFLTNGLCRDLRHRCISHGPERIGRHLSEFRQTVGGTSESNFVVRSTAANPYLALAVCLAAGLDGIRSKIMPPDSIDRNLFEMSEEELKARQE